MNFFEPSDMELAGMFIVGFIASAISWYLYLRIAPPKQSGVYAPIIKIATQRRAEFRWTLMMNLVNATAFLGFWLFLKDSPGEDGLLMRIMLISISSWNFLLLNVPFWLKRLNPFEKMREYFRKARPRVQSIQNPPSIRRLQDRSRKHHYSR